MRVGVVGIAALEVASGRRASAVIVDYHRIFLRRIKRGGQIVAAMDTVAARVDVAPGMEFAQLYVGELRGHRLVHQRRRILAKIQAVEAVGVLRSVTGECGEAAGLRNGERAGHILRKHDTADFARLRVEPIETHLIAVFGREIYLAVSLAPLHRSDTRIEIARHRPEAAVGARIDVKLIVDHRRHASIGHAVAYAAESLGRAGHGHLRRIGREQRAAYESVVGHDRIETHVVEVKYGKSEHRCGPLLQTAARQAHQHLARVCADVERLHGRVAECQRLHDARGDVV